MCLTKTIIASKKFATKIEKLSKKERTEWALSLFEVAKEDILVRKHVKPYGKKYKSPFFHFTYERGFHYYRTNPKFGISVMVYPNIYSKMYYIHIYVGEGLHCYDKTNPGLSWRTYLNAKIPKGSLYLQVKGKIVTDNLIIL